MVLAGAMLRIGYSQIQLNPLINDNAKSAWEAGRFIDNFGFKTLLNIPTHLEPFSWALLFKIFGSNTFAFNFLGIIQYAILSIFFYLAIEKISGKRVALASVSLLAFSPPIFTLNSIFWSGHSRGAMLTWIIFYLFCLIWEEPARKRFLILGLLGGFSTANIAVTPLFALLAPFIALILKDRKILRKSDFYIFFVFFILSFALFYNFSPIARAPIYDWLGKIDFYNLDIGFFKKLAQTARISLTIAGVNSTYQLKVGFQSGLTKVIYGLIFSLAALFWLYDNRKIIFKAPSRELIFPSYLFLFFSSAALTKIGVATRYYLPVITIYIYFLSYALVKLAEHNIRKLKIFSLSAMFSIFAFSIANNLNFYSSPYKGVFKFIEFAEQNNIKAVFTNYNMQFAVAFYSRGAIAASSPPDPVINQASELDAIVQNSSLPSYLLEGKESRFFENCLTKRGVTYKKKDFDGLILYYSLSRHLLPAECP